MSLSNGSIQQRGTFVESAPPIAGNRRGGWDFGGLESLAGPGRGPGGGGGWGGAALAVEEALHCGASVAGGAAVVLLQGLGGVARRVAEQAGHRGQLAVLGRQGVAR